MKPTKLIILKISRGFYRVFKTLLEGSLRLLFFLLLLVGATVVCLQIPTVQKKLVDIATDYVSEKLHFPVSIGAVGISWLDEIVLENVLVKDPQAGKMIAMGKAIVDFEILDFINLDITIEDITLKDGSVNVIAYKNGRLNINDFIDAIKGKDKSKTPRNNKPTAFKVPYVALVNMNFSYNDVAKPRIADFDHGHFEFDSIYGDIYNLKIIGDTFKIDVKNLKSIETHTKLRIHSLHTNYLITDRKMEFDLLDAKIGGSHIKNYMNFAFSEIGNLSFFLDSTTVTLDMDQSVVSLQDISVFAPALKPYKDKITLSGLFKGKVGDFGVKNLSLGLGNKSIFKGRLQLKGLPNVRETFIDFAFKDSQLDARDLRQYCDPFTYRQFEKFSTIAGNGKFIGFANDFVASGNFKTGLGNLVADINFKIDDKKYKHPFYEGSVKTSNFNLGKLIEQEDYVGSITIDGHIEGVGVELSYAKVKVNASIPKLQLNGYEYKNIKTNAALQNRLFDGLLEIRDSNLVIEMVGKIDLRKNINIINISGKIEKANLKPLNLSWNNKDALLKTNFYIDFKGLEIDDIDGEFGLVNTYLLYKGVKEVVIDSLKIATHKQDNNRTFTIDSDLLTLTSHGKFDFTTLIADCKRLYKEYSISLSNNEAEIQSYYASKNATAQVSSQLDFELHAKDLNQILSIYVPNLYLSSGFFVKGDLTTGRSNILNAQTFIDTLYFNENEFIKTEIECSISKAADVKDVNASLFINSKLQKLKSGLDFRNLYFEGNWKNDAIDFKSKLYQQDSEDYIVLNGDLKLGDRTQTLVLNNSELHILNQVWKLREENKTFFTKSTIGFENIKIENGMQQVSLDGEMSNDPEHESRLTFTDFRMENVNPLLKNMKLKGNLNGSLELKKVFSGIQAVGNITLDTFIVDGFKVGDIHGVTAYDKATNTLKAGVQVVRDDIKVIDVKGDIIPGSDTSDSKLDLSASLNGADLELLNPMLSGVLSNIGGKATGVFKIKGSTKSISILGKADVKRGKFTVPYLGTTYYFDDQIYLTENLIGFKNLTLKDSEGHTGNIDGGLYHDHFNHFIVDIRGLFKNMKVLNLQEKDNKLFYGEANITGDFEILGAFDDLKINANASTTKGTRIFIPVNSSSSLEQQSYIKFVSKKENALKKVGRDSVDISGLKMEFNLELSPSTYAEIIFDKRTGDIIRGYGQGNLKLKIDTRGDFTMEGDYAFTQGWYNFTLAGLINKEFKIKNGSSISWSGDPYTGTMNIEADYLQYVSMRPLVNDSADLKNSEVNRKYPTEVKLGLKGNLLTPEIKMGIDILKNPTFMNEEVLAFKNKLANNEQEMNRQVFSVLVLGGFASDNFKGSASPANNLSEMLSNQLSNWLSQVDDKLQIDLNLNSLDRNALNTFQMRLSYTLLDGRLRISRDGSFQNSQNPNQTNISNIAGEWTVEYLLSPDGMFRLKLFNRINQNILINSAGGNSSSSAGFSVLHTQSFNSLKELVKPPKDNITQELNNYILKKTQEENKILEDQQTAPATVPVSKEGEINNPNKVIVAPKRDEDGM